MPMWLSGGCACSTLVLGGWYKCTMSFGNGVNVGGVDGCLLVMEWLKTFCQDPLMKSSDSNIHLFLINQPVGAYDVHVRICRISCSVEGNSNITAAEPSKAAESTEANIANVFSRNHSTNSTMQRMPCSTIPAGAWGVSPSMPTRRRVIRSVKGGCESKALWPRPAIL